MSTAELVVKLKDEGNALFSQKNYGSAAAKYTEAIAIDRENAILYSNRAACRLNLKTYLDAEADAKKATEIDPNFAKAYARLASAQDAMREPYRSVESWQKAISNLPKDNLTPTQLNQKAEYEKGLVAAKVAMADLMNNTNHLVQNTLTADMPWVCARRKIPLLIQQGDYTSSAWALAGAYTEFTEGVRKIFAATTEGTLRIQSTGALASISNAILTDHRVFHIADPQFIRKYNEQVLGEVQFFNAWTQEGPDSIKQKVRKRLEEQGWDAVRPALTTTVRGWIMQGFYQGGMYRNNVAEREYLTRAIEVIKWVREEYSDVRKEYRGAIFEETFLRGVQKLHLEALLKSMQNADDVTMKAALQEANEVIEGVDAAPIPPRERDPSFVSAFYYHAKGQALSLKAIYYRNKGNQIRAKQDLSLSEPMLENFTLAKRYYLEAADCLAEDDEGHAVYLNAALEMMWSSKTSARDQLAVMERIRLAIPKMKQIWAHSALAAQGGDMLFKRGLEMETELRQGVESGEFQLDDPVTLQIED